MMDGWTGGSGWTMTQRRDADEWVSGRGRKEVGGAVALVVLFHRSHQKGAVQLQSKTQKSEELLGGDSLGNTPSAGRTGLEERDQHHQLPCPHSHPPAGSMLIYTQALQGPKALLTLGLFCTHIHNVSINIVQVFLLQ